MHVDHEKGGGMVVDLSPEDLEELLRTGSIDWQGIPGDSPHPLVQLLSQPEEEVSRAEITQGPFGLYLGIYISEVPEVTPILNGPVELATIQNENIYYHLTNRRETVEEYYGPAGGIVLRAVSETSLIENI